MIHLGHRWQNLQKKNVSKVESDFTDKILVPIPDDPPRPPPPVPKEKPFFLKFAVLLDKMLVSVCIYPLMSIVSVLKGNKLVERWYLYRMYGFSDELFISANVILS
jgi:hypothetical protein